MKRLLHPSQSLCSLATTMLLGLSLDANSAENSRTIVERAADLIEQNFYDAGAAGEIAKRLREEARTGRFDAASDSRNLASLLTRELKPFDRHFNVNVIEGASGLPSDAHYAYGFREVRMLPGAVGYIDLRFFSEDAEHGLNTALTLLSGADALIVDLRGNPGGSQSVVGYFVSAFVAPEADVYDVLHYRDRIESDRPRKSFAAPLLDKPLYILICGRTASAAEAFAYTMQAAHRAVIVGEASFGAPNPGGEFPLTDKLRLFISISTPVNPITHTNWSTTGVLPDVRIRAAETVERAQMLALETIIAKNPAGTTEARWVLEALRSRSSPPAGPALNEYAGIYADARISAGNGELLLSRQGRPPVAAMRVRADIFFVVDEPFRRIVFRRNAQRDVVAFELTRANGPSTWFSK